MSTPHIYIIAGEASGDMLGAGLMRALKEATQGNILISGIGGEQMEAEGLHSLFPYHELSLMGFAEIVPKLISLLARIDFVIEDIETKHPDVLVTIDSPGFNFQVVKKLRKHGLEHTKCVHYVAPTVWAYKPERALKCAELFDHMLCLLPFELPYFEAVELPATYVGHPVAYRTPGDGAAFRQKYGFPQPLPLLALLPGSRESEIRRHMPVIAEAISKLGAVMPMLSLVVPVSKRLAPLVAEYLSGSPFRAVIIDDPDEKPAAISACNAAIVKSGTVSLEVAAYGVPQVVMYRVHPITAWIVQKIVKIKHVNLINIMAEDIVIPELLQQHCTGYTLANALTPLLCSAEHASRQTALAQTMLNELRLPGDVHPSTKAAEVVLSIGGER